MQFPYAIIDANINRATEGLRVIEEYTRFISQNKAQTDALSALRKKISHSEPHPEKNLKIRNTSKDVRALDPPNPRHSLLDLLKANFKRAEEAFRVLEEYTSLPLYNEARYELYQLEKQILLPLYRKTIPKGVYLISDNPEVLLKGLEWKVALIQYRNKSADKPTKLNAAHTLQKAATLAGIPFIINDDLDIALLADTDGFHSGQDDLSVSEQRKLLGEHKIIGKTTHSLDQGLIAQSEGADYISVGPIYETPSKPGRVGIGTNYLRQAQTQIHIPYVAIGGLNLNNIPDILPHHPHLIGLIRDYHNIPEIQELL